jgi:hypothetical protein
MPNVRAGLARTGPVLARGRPYSVVARVPTESGTVWFKASPPASRFEPALIGALAAWHPDRFATPVAVDLDRAWSLTRDGRRTLREQESRTGDAVLRTAAEHVSLLPRSRELAVLTENYLKPWLDAGHPRAAADRSLALALRIAPLARALTWGRLFPCYLGHSGPAAHAARALAAVLKPGPLAPRG